MPLYTVRGKKAPKRRMYHGIEVVGNPRDPMGKDGEHQADRIMKAIGYKPIIKRGKVRRTQYRRRR